MSSNKNKSFRGRFCTMNCEDIKPILPLYLNNELDHQQYKLVAEHMESCSRCQSELYDLQGVDNLFKDYLKPKTAPEFNYNRMKSKKRSYYISSVAAAVLLFFIIFFAVQRDKPDLSWDNNRLTELVELNDDMDILYSEYALSNSLVGYNHSVIYNAFYSISEDVDYLQELGN